MNLYLLLDSIFFQIEQTDQLYLSTQRFMSNTVLPCDWIKSLDNQIENQDHLSAVPISSYTSRNSMNESKCIRDNFNLVWEKVQSSLSSNSFSKLRTWECLGISESSKQLLFVTDLPETALHLARIRQTSILSLLSEKVKITMLAGVYYHKNDFALCYRQCILHL